MMTHHKLALLGALYLSQGLPYGFFQQALPAMLRQQGLSLTSIGLTSLLAAPWALKFLWAPAMDRLGSARRDHRARWIIPLQLGAALTLLALSPLDPATSLPWILGGILLTNLLAATQDVATDGLAVESLSPQERGLGNGVQVAAYRVGMIIGGGALLIAYDHLGWSGTFLCLAALLALATAPILRYRTLPRDGEARPATSPTTDSAWQALRGWLSVPGQRAWVVALVCYKLGESLATGMLRPFLIDRGMTLSDIGWALGGGGFVAGLLGALVGGYGASRLGRRPALLLFGAAQALGVSSYAAVAWGGADHAALYVACALEHFTSGMATAALFTWMMDRCRPGHASADYTSQACVVVLATGIAQAASGALADAVGYPAHFSASLALCALGLIACARLTRPQAHTSAAAP